MSLLLLLLLLLMVVVVVLPAAMTLRPCFFFFFFFFVFFPSAAQGPANAPGLEAGAQVDAVGCAWGGWMCVREYIRRGEEGRGGRGGKTSAENQPRGRSKGRAAAPQRARSCPCHALKEDVPT